MEEFTGKVSLVTGAGSGIGRASALLYAHEGAKVVVVDYDEAGGHETVNMIQKAQGEAFFVKADVSQPEACNLMVMQALDRYSRLDMAFNNAGIGGEANLTAEYSVESWQRVISINLSGVFYSMKYEIPAMLLNGGGAIVNMSSILGQVGFGQSVAYVAAKHGVVGLTREAALDYANQGIRINSIGPAFIRTPLISSLEENEAVLKDLISRHPIGRLGEPEEVAELAIWLSSNRASFITGAYIPIDGGYLAK